MMNSFRFDSGKIRIKNCSEKIIYQKKQLAKEHLLTIIAGL